MVVDSEGKQVKGSGGMVCDYSVCGPGGSFYNANPWGMYSSGTVESNGHKMIYEAPTNKGSMAGNYRASGNSQDQMTYNFKTNTWTRGAGATRGLHCAILLPMTTTLYLPTVAGKKLIM